MKITPEKLNQWLRYTHEMDKGMQKTRPRFVCEDGTTLSIQAGEFLYSSPRSNSAIYYIAVEVGFPSVTPPITWQNYADGDDHFICKVWGYVPVELVCDYINDHGGARV